MYMYINIYCNFVGKYEGASARNRNANRRSIHLVRSHRLTRVVKLRPGRTLVFLLLCTGTRFLLRAYCYLLAVLRGLPARTSSS